MSVSKVLGSVLLSIALAGCAGGEATTAPPAGEAGKGPAEDLGVEIAKVGDVSVYSKEFEAAAARKTPADGKALSPAERKEVLDKLIEEKALYLEARAKGVDKDPKVQKVMTNTLLRQEVYASVRNSDFTQDELRAYFDAHRDEFVVPEKMQLKRIFLKVDEKRSDADALKKAGELYAKVKADPSKFAEIATENSEDPYRRRGGDLGFVGKDGKPGIDQGVVDKAFTMAQGQVSEPFLAGGGYNIVYVANKRERVERTFEQMRGSVLRKVKNEKYRTMYDSYVAEVGKKYPAQVFQEKVDAIVVDPSKRMSLGGEGMELGGDEMDGPGEEGGMPGGLPGGMPPGMMPPGMMPPGATAPGVAAPPAAPAPGK